MRPDAQLAETVDGQADHENADKIRRECVGNKIKEVKGHQVAQVPVGSYGARITCQADALGDHDSNAVDGQGDIGQNGRWRAAENFPDMLGKRCKQIEILDGKCASADQQELQQLQESFARQAGKRFCVGRMISFRV